MSEGKPTIYYGSTGDWFEEIGACISVEQAAAEFASMEGLCVGDSFTITTDPQPNPDHDPEWPTGPENPEFYLNGPRHTFEVTINPTQETA
jgi:poly(3-hydroxybutyrate) depolymerase